MPPEHPLTSKAVIESADLDGERFIALAMEDRTRQEVDALMTKLGVRPKVVVETPASAMVCAPALEGVGIGLVNPAAADGFALRGLALRPFEPAIYFKSILLFRPDAQKARLVKSFVAELLRARSPSRFSIGVPSIPAQSAFHQWSMYERFCSLSPLG